MNRFPNLKLEGARNIVGPYRYFEKKYKRESMILTGWLVLSGLLELAGLFMLMPLLNQNVQNSRQQQLSIVLLLFIFLLLSSTSRRWGEKHSAKLRCKIELQQRSEILGKLINVPWKYISRFDQSDLDTALTSEVSQAVNGYIALLGVLPAMLTTFFMFFSTLFINPILSGFSIAIGYVAFKLSRDEARKQKASQKSLSDSYIDLNRETSSLVVNLKFLRSSGQQENFYQLTNSRFKKISELIYSSMNAPSRAKWITEVSGITLLFMILGSSVLQGDSIAKSLVFIAILFRLTPKMQNIQSGWILVAQQSIWMKQWVDRLTSLQAGMLDQRPTEESIEEILVETHQISISNVSVSFPSRSLPALNNVSLSIGLNERVAFVGRSGSGKSTLIDVITGVVPPDAGAVRIRGKALDDKEVESWKRSIAWTPQIPALRTGTIFDNLAWLGSEISEEDVWHGLKVAELDEFVLALPNGLTEEINPKTELSGGQGQRLALARAVARRPLLLILDETTSSLDEEVEARIVSNLATLNCGLILATHRIKPLQVCPRTIEFSEGSITFDGPTETYLRHRAQLGN